MFSLPFGPFRAPVWPFDPQVFEQIIATDSLKLAGEKTGNGEIRVKGLAASIKPTKSTFVKLDATYMSRGGSLLPETAAQDS